MYYQGREKWVRWCRCFNVNLDAECVCCVQILCLLTKFFANWNTWSNRISAGVTSLGWMKLWRASSIRSFRARSVSILILVRGVSLLGDLTRCLLRAVGLFSSYVFISMICFFLFKFIVTAVSRWRVWMSLDGSLSSQVVRVIGSTSTLLLWWLLLLASLRRQLGFRDCRHCFVVLSVSVPWPDRLLLMTLATVSIPSWMGCNWVAHQHRASCWSSVSSEEIDWSHT